MYKEWHCLYQPPAIMILDLLQVTNMSAALLAKIINNFLRRIWLFSATRLDILLVVSKSWSNLIQLLYNAVLTVLSVSDNSDNMRASSNIFLPNRLS